MKAFFGSLILSVLVLLIWTSSVFSESFPYRTSFEEPNFSVGNLDGQGGWENVSDPAGAGSIQSSENSGIQSGTQSLMIEAASVVGRTFAATSEQIIYVDGYYRGPTVDFIPDATQMEDPGSSLILFHVSNGIMGLDGDGLGGGDWTLSGIPVSSDTLQRITIRQDYSTQTWDLYVDGQKVLEGLGFKNNTVTRLSGINIETSADGPGFLDDFSVTTAPPAFLGGPVLFSFQSEWTENSGNLNWDISPIEPDGEVNPNDLLKLIGGIRK